MSKRAPAQIVKCPHCDHTGSARGLFTHIRLAHPGISNRPPISKNEHPYAIGNRVATALDKKKPKTKVQSVEEILITTISMAVLKGLNNWLESTSVADRMVQLQSIGEIPTIQREAKKPK
jgi:hypothetical protein